MKVFSKFNEFSLAGNRGTWVRDGDTIISVDQQSASTRFGGVKVFSGPERRLSPSAVQSRQVSPATRSGVSKLCREQFAMAARVRAHGQGGRAQLCRRNFSAWP
jgi:hypothetical protein